MQTVRSSHTNGVTANYTYDNLNRLSSVVDNRLTAGANTTTYGYNPDSNLLSTTLPNGVLTTATYNTLDRLTNLTTTKGATTLASYAYTLRPEGNRSQVIETGPVARTVNYGYDNAYRLTSETISAPSSAIGATYDHTGNRLTRTSSVGAASATYDANDRQAGITYDSNGNTTLAGSITYGYDFLNRLTSATGGITLKYDGDGNRVSETVGSVTTQYLVDDNNPTGYPQVVEESVSGVVQRQYTYGHALLSQNQTSGVSFYGLDAQHNVRFLTNAAGAVTDQYTYDSFGNLISSSGTTPNSYRFAGEQLDASLGLYYLRARYYNASTGRFWNRDSAEINTDDPRELNRYVYTADNPANATDPSGQMLEGMALQTTKITIPTIVAAKSLAWAIIAATGLTAIALTSNVLFSQRGRNDQRNYIVDNVQRVLPRGGDPCEVLEDWYKAARAAGDKQRAKDIVKAQKYFDCRRHRD